MLVYLAALGKKGKKKEKCNMPRATLGKNLSVLIGREAGRFGELELELELIFSRYLWGRRGKGGASLQKQERVRALCGVV